MDVRNQNAKKFNTTIIVKEQERIELIKTNSLASCILFALGKQYWELHAVKHRVKQRRVKL